MELGVYTFDAFVFLYLVVVSFVYCIGFFECDTYQQLRLGNTTLLRSFKIDWVWLTRKHFCVKVHLTSAYLKYLVLVA